MPKVLHARYPHPLLPRAGLPGQPGAVLGHQLGVDVRHMRANNLRATTIQQYEVALRVFRKAFPDSKGPADVTPEIAEEFKLKRLDQGLAKRTVENDVGDLSIVFGKWFKSRLRIIGTNPFVDVEVPRYDKPPARFIGSEEQQSLFKWLTDRWGWRMPVLFLEVKAAIGCGIGELSAALSVNLRDGLLHFPADATKGREERACLLPSALFDELGASAGPTYVFERFSEELKAAHRRKGHHYPANAVKGFTPARLKRWVEDEANTYFEKTKAPRFKLHNSRGTAMSKARLAGVPEDDAAIAFDCTPQTMRGHYLAFDKTTVADRVFEKMRASGAVSGANGNGKSGGTESTGAAADPNGELGKSGD